MNQHKQKTHSKKYDSCNARKENFQMKEMRPKCGLLMETIENLSCCPAPTAAPKYTVDPCDKTVTYKDDFCTSPKDQCANPSLTQYGKEFVAGTGKMVSKRKAVQLLQNFNIHICREIHFLTFLITIYCNYIF